MKEYTSTSRYAIWKIGGVQHANSPQGMSVIYTFSDVVQDDIETEEEAKLLCEEGCKVLQYIEGNTWRMI